MGVNADVEVISTTMLMLRAVVEHGGKGETDCQYEDSDTDINAAVKVENTYRIESRMIASRPAYGPFACSAHRTPFFWIWILDPTQAQPLPRA